MISIRIPSKSRARIRGAEYRNATLLPVVLLMVSTIWVGSSPARAPRASASATRMRLTCINMLLTSFIAMPWPSAPKCVISEVIA